MKDNVHLVIERIERAFADVRLGGGVSLREADVIDNYGTDAERRKARAQDEQNDWKRIPEDLIAHYYWCLSFFDSKGLQFHIPAYMCFVLRHYRDSASASIDSTIYALGHEDERFLGFTGPQRAAVRQFLKFMAYNGGRYVDGTSAKRALLDVWRVETSSQPDGRGNGGPPFRCVSHDETSTTTLPSKPGRRPPRLTGT